MGVVIDYSSGFFEAAPTGETVGSVTGNATLDLSSGNVFSHTPTANTTFVFSNPPASGTAYDFTLKVTGANVAQGYDIANASYETKSFSISSQIGSQNPQGITFNATGSKVYICENGGYIYEYDLSTAFDISTASYNNNRILIGGYNTGQETRPSGLRFNNDGTKIFFTGYAMDNVNRWSLSTPYDITSATNDNNTISIASQDNTPKDIHFNSDGTKLFVLGSQYDKVYMYNLSTAFDLSTASYASSSVSVQFEEHDPTGLHFNDDGTKMFIIGTNQDGVDQYNLSTAFDLSTASYANVTFSVSSQESIPLGFEFNGAGTKFYVLGTSNDTIYQYSSAGSAAAATFSYPSSVKWSGGTAPTAPANGETDVYTFYTDDGGTTYYGFQSGDALA